MPTPTETVTQFLSRWEKPGELNQAIRDAFTPDTVWENVGMATTTGPEEAIALNQGFEDNLGMAAIKVEMLALAEADGKVLTERIDHILDRAGNALMSAPVMGVFEVSDGKITAWRDYFDSARFAQQDNA
jgi:limonene-1,2-epoxide hydrolase